MKSKIKYILIALLIIVTSMSFLMKTTYAANDDAKVKKAIEEMGSQKGGAWGAANNRDAYPKIKEASEKNPEKIVEWWKLIKDKSDKYPGQWSCLKENITYMVKRSKKLDGDEGENGNYDNIKVHESKANLSEKEIMKLTSEDMDKANKDDLEGWKKTIEEALKKGNLTDEEKKKYEEKLKEIEKKEKELDEETKNGWAPQPSAPKATGNFSRFASTQKNKEHTPDEIITEADNFVESGAKEESPLETSAMKNVSNTIYNIFLAVGTAASVIVGMILGIKFMLANVEGKAEVKQAIIPYIVGCVVLFGAFGIWKIVLIVMSNL